MSIKRACEHEKNYGTALVRFLEITNVNQYTFLDTKFLVDSSSDKTENI